MGENMTDEVEVRQLYRLVCEVKSEVGIVRRKVDAALNYNQTQFEQTHRRMDQILESVQQPRAPNHEGVPRDIASPISSTTDSLSSTSEDGILGNVDRRTSCMANAFQRNIKAILHNIKFEMIQDKIVERDLVTTSESEELSQLPDDRTKMRVLVTNIMDKKESAMQAFLELIGEYDQRLKECIQIAFDSSIEDSRSDECTACLIQKRINIQDLSDSLVAQEVISRDLYKNIAHDRSMYTDKLWQWQVLFDAISHLPRALGATALQRALTDNEGIDSHADIVRHIQRDLARNRKSINCRCSQNNYDDGTTLPFASYSSQTSDIRTPDNLSEDEASADSDSSTIPEVLPRSQESYEPIGSRRIAPFERLLIAIGKPLSGIQALQSSTSTQMGARPKLQIGDSHRSQNIFFEDPQWMLTSSQTTTTQQPICETADEPNEVSVGENRDGSDDMKTDHNPVRSNIRNVTEINLSNGPLRQTVNSNSRHFFDIRTPDNLSEDEANIETADDTNKLSLVGNKEGSDDPETGDSDPHPELSNKVNITQQNVSRQPQSPTADHISRHSSDMRISDNLSEDNASDDSDTSMIAEALSNPQGNDEGISSKRSSRLRERPHIPSINSKSGIQIIHSSTSTQMGTRPKLQTGDSHQSQNTLSQDTQQILVSKSTTKPQQNIETADDTNKLSLVSNKEDSDDPKTEDSDPHPELSNIGNILTEQNMPRQSLRPTTNSYSLKATSCLKLTNPELADNNVPSTRIVPLTGYINKFSHMANASAVSNETVEYNDGQKRGVKGKSTLFSKILEAHEQKIKANINVEPERKTLIPIGSKVGNSRRYPSVTEQKGNITSASNMSAKPSSVQKAVPKSAIPSTRKATARPRLRQPMTPNLAMKIRQLNKEEDIPEEDD